MADEGLDSGYISYRAHLNKTGPQHFTPLFEPRPKVPGPNLLAVLRRESDELSDSNLATLQEAEDQFAILHDNMDGAMALLFSATHFGCDEKDDSEDYIQPFPLELYCQPGTSVTEYM